VGLEVEALHCVARLRLIKRVEHELPMGEEEVLAGQRTEPGHLIVVATLAGQTESGNREFLIYVLTQYYFLGVH
jgi:hypothetical protein